MEGAKALNRPPSARRLNSVGSPVNSPSSARLKAAAAAQGSPAHHYKGLVRRRFADGSAEGKKVGTAVSVNLNDRTLSILDGDAQEKLSLPELSVARRAGAIDILDPTRGFFSYVPRDVADASELFEVEAQC